MKYGEEWVYDHVFGAFQDRFDASVCNHLKALEKAAGDVAAARVEAYCEMRDYLRSLSEESFRPKPPVMWRHHCKNSVTLRARASRTSENKMANVFIV